VKYILLVVNICITESNICFEGLDICFVDRIYITSDKYMFRVSNTCFEELDICFVNRIYILGDEYMFEQLTLINSAVSIIFQRFKCSYQSIDPSCVQIKGDYQYNNKAFILDLIYIYCH
jgi:hypothetical protein